MTLRRACAFAFAVGFAASAVGAGVPAARFAQTTGDEPHYLITALSIARDRSLDVSDELRSRDYEPFHAARIDPQEKPLGSGRMVSPHDPFLPLLLAAPLALGGWIAAKLLLAALAGALAALLVWTAVRRFAVPVVRALVVVAVLAASAPLAPYGTQVYPELPAALAVTAAVASTAAAPAAVVLLPWLSAKFVVVAAVLAVLTLRRRWWLLGVYAGAAAAYLVAHKLLYGGWTPYAAGDHFVDGELTVIGHDPDYLGRSRRLLGLLVDRTFGLAAWQPAWLLVVPALAALAVRRPRGWALLAAPLAAGWLVATFVALTMHGWWFPGRQLVAVLPLGVLAIAWWATRLRTVGAVGAAGVFSWMFLVGEGYGSGISLVVSFFETGNPLYRVWRHALPDFWHENAWTWPLAAAWLLALAAYAYTATRRAWGRSDTRAPSGTTSVDGRWATSTVSPTATR